MSSAFMFARSANELAANPPRRVGPPPEEPTLWAQQTIVVDKEHQSVRIVATAVPRVSGRLLFEGPEPKLRETELAALSVVLHPVDHPVITQIFPDRVSRTGTFTTFGAPPGRYFPSVLGDLTGWNLESITFGGQNVTDMWLELGSGAPSELVFTFSRHRSGGIRGTVSDRQGRPNAEALVVAFPQDRGQRTHVGPKPRRIRAAMTSGQGVYDLQGLPAGDYLVAAVTGPEARNWEQAAFLERLSREAAAVRIGRSETQVVNLVLSGR